MLLFIRIKMKAKVYIFSRPIRTGKTTELQHWMSLKNNVDGVLMPDIEGKRHFQFYKNNIFIPIEAYNKEKHFSIGKFKFKIDAFQQAKQYLNKALDHSIDFLVIDEIGKLEVEQKSGFEPGISNLINNAIEKNINLVIVVRASLLEEIIQHYQFKNAIIINELSEINSWKS